MVDWAMYARQGVHQVRVVASDNESFIGDPEEKLPIRRGLISKVAIKPFIIDFES